jgi:hypothetical protein
MARVIVILGEVAPFAGLCPVCDGVMDDSGCRIGPWGDRQVRPAARARTGIARVVEMECLGRPAHPVAPCPSCSADSSEDL